MSSSDGRPSRRPDRQHPVTRQLRAALLATPLALGLVSCGTASGAAGTPSEPAQSALAGQHRAGDELGHGVVADLQVDGGYVVEAASPAVAASYLTITNTGATGDQLLQVTSPVAAQVKAMTEQTTGSSTRMEDLGPVDLPAGSETAFTPGHAHLMLMDPDPRPVAGDTVPLTLVFRDAGTLDLELPVLSLTETPGASTGSGATR